MPIDMDLYSLPADRSDVGRTTITTVVALHSIAQAFEAIERGDTTALETAIAEIRESATRLSKHFNELSGWTDE